MTWETTRVGVYYTRGLATPVHQNVYPPQDATNVGVRDGLLISVERDRFPMGQRALVTTTISQQVRIEDRLCLLVTVEIANSDPQIPLATDDTFGRYSVAFQGCHALPCYALSHGGQWEAYTPQETYVYHFPTWEHGVLGTGTTIPTHTFRAMRFLAVQPEGTETQADALRWLTEVLLDSRWKSVFDTEDFHWSFELPMRASFESETFQPESAWRYQTADPKNLWGFRQDPNGSGDDQEFGTDPWPGLRGWDSQAAALNLDRRLLVFTGHQPQHLYDRRYVPTPSEESWKFTGELSDHSRNRKGLPHRTQLEQLARFKKGRVAIPDSIEHVALPGLHLAWYTGDPYWCEKAIDYGYWLMNTLHTKRVGISQGGYDSPLWPILRFHRSIIALQQCAMVAREWAKVMPSAFGPAQEFFQFLREKIDEIHDLPEWRQQGYPDWSIFTRPDGSGQVNGKLCLAVWQAGFVIQAMHWSIQEQQNTTKARQILKEMVQIVLAGWVQQDGTWKMGKLLETKPLSTPNWPHGELGFVHESLDRLVTWPYAGLKLASGYHRALFSAPELDKLDTIVRHLETRFPEVVDGRWGSIAVPARPLEQ